MVCLRTTMFIVRVYYPPKGSMIKKNGGWLLGILQKNLQLSSQNRNTPKTEIWKDFLHKRVVFCRTLLVFSEDSWMYTYQRTPMGNPYISTFFVGIYGLWSPRILREHIKDHGYIGVRPMSLDFWHQKNVEASLASDERAMSCFPSYFHVAPWSMGRWHCWWFRNPARKPPGMYKT